MNRKLLAVPCTVLALGALIAGACTITEGDVGGGLGGFGGETASGGSQNGSGGSSQSSGGSDSGSGGSDGGAGATLDCAEDGVPEGTRGSAEPPADANDCQLCIIDLCEAEYTNCSASDPDTACWWGSTAHTVPGEFDCILDCLQTARDEGGAYVAGEDDLDACRLECGSAECDTSSAGPLAVELGACMLGLYNEENPLACQEECALEPLED